MGDVIKGPWDELPPANLYDHGGLCPVVSCNVIIQPMPGGTLSDGRNHHMSVVHNPERWDNEDK